MRDGAMRVIVGVLVAAVLVLTVFVWRLDQRISELDKGFDAGLKRVRTQAADDTYSQIDRRESEGSYGRYAP